MRTAGKPRGAPGAALGGAGEERGDDLQEGLRLFGMDPMSGTFDARDPGPREHSPDAGFVLWLDVVGAGSRDEQCRPPVSSAHREVGKADDLWEAALDRSEVQAPAGGIFSDHQILQQETAFGGVGNRPDEPGIDLGAPGDAAKIDRPHGADIGEQVWPIY